MSYPRCFKPYSVAQTAQPLIGTTFTNKVLQSDQAQTVTVTDSSMFVNSDTILCVPAAGGKPTELAIQIQVISSTSIKGIFNKEHASGEYVVLSWPCQNVMVQAVSANPPSASIFLGTGSAVPTTAGVNAFHDLLLTLFYSGPPGYADSDNTANYWIIAASGTQFYLPSAVQS